MINWDTKVKRKAEGPFVDNSSPEKFYRSLQ
jgi:hypothetical protein